MAGVSAGRQDHPGRLFRRHGHQSVLRSHGTYPPLPRHRYQLVALLPLVPGGGIYYAMGYCLEGDTEQFLSALLGTLGMAAALAVGVILASSLFRAVFPRLARVPKRMPSGRQNP